MIVILKKSTDARTLSDVGSVMPYLRHCAFFKEMSIQGKDLQDVCELVTHEQYPKGKLYDIGDGGDKMYIVLDGLVEFSIDMEKHHVIMDDAEELG